MVTDQVLIGSHSYTVTHTERAEHVQDLEGGEDVTHREQSMVREEQEKGTGEGQEREQERERAGERESRRERAGEKPFSGLPAR